LSRKQVVRIANERVRAEFVSARLWYAGIKRATAEQMMRSLDVVPFPGLRKICVKREDVLSLIKSSTFTKDQVAA